MLVKGNYAVSRNAKGSTKLYYCEHCKKHISYKTYLRHSKLFLKQEKAAITVDLPSFTGDPETGAYDYS